MGRPRGLGILVLSTVPWLTPGEAAAQAPEPARSERPGVGAFVGPTIRLGRVHHQGSVLLGVQGGLTLGRRFGIGGGGLGLSRDIHLERDGSRTGHVLGLGYGGVVVEYRALERGRYAFVLTGTLGAGHARVRDGGTGQELGAENFALIEPELAISVNLGRFLRGRAGLGLRVPWAMGGLPGVEARDVRGPSLGFTLLGGSF